MKMDAKKGNMDFLKLAKSRKTTYEFTDKMLPERDINRILEAGRWAPSSHNSQPWKFILIKDKKRINEMMDTCYYGFFHTLPTAMIMIVLEPMYIDDQEALIRGKAEDFILSHKYLNVGMPVLSMVFAAASYGIASCIMSPLKKDADRILKIPKKSEAVIAIGFGYEKKGAFRKPRERKKMKDVLFHEHYNNRG